MLVNTAVIGNYTQLNVGVALPGILATATYHDEALNLLGSEAKNYYTQRLCLVSI